jgi:hypothetical protein
MANGYHASMRTPTSYLYGDSTPSPLKTDFVAFLRDAFDFAVEVLLCDARLADTGRRLAQLSDATEKEIERAEALATDVSRALDGAAVGSDESLAARCALRIRQGAMDLIRSEADGARTAVVAERTRAAQAMGNEHDAAVKAFEVLLLRHMLPDSVGAMRVAIEGGERYDAQLRGYTPYGLEWVLAIEIPPAHPLAHVLRIDRVVERLEVDAPEEGGWLHKEVRIRPQRFDRLHLAELTVEPGATTVKLRTAPDGTGGGFDVLFKTPSSNAQLVRVVEGGVSADAPYDIVGDDLAKLRSLHDTLVAMASELGEHKQSLKTASLEKIPLGMLEAPRVLVERLVANIAPTVQEIAKRSLVPGELVLKRLLGDNHRDEVFLSKSELEKKLEGLPPELRSAFDPLGLWDAGAAPRLRPPAPPQEPAAKVSPRRDPPEEKGAGGVLEVVDDGWAQPRAPAAIAASPTVIVAAEPNAEGPVPAATTLPSSQPPRSSVRPPRP